MKNFLIVGTQRSGSSALGDEIGRHPNVACGWEWTQYLPLQSKLRVAEMALNGDFSRLAPADQQHMKEVFKRDVRWLGFRRLFSSSNIWLIHPRYAPALWIERLEGHLAWLMKRSDIYIVHIVRCDGPDWLKSKFLARHTNMYVGDKYPEGTKVVIPIGEAVARLQSKNWVDGRLAMMEETNPYIRVHYEDMLVNQDNVAKNVLRFLGCNMHYTPLRERLLNRQSKGAVWDYVLNYGELVAQLRRHNLLESPF